MRKRFSVPAHRALVTTEQLSRAGLSGAHIAKLDAASERIPNFDAQFVPVGLARKALRARRAQRRAIRLSRRVA